MSEVSCAHRMLCTTWKQAVIHFSLYAVHSQDTTGQERCLAITTAHYRGAVGFILMYDITNEKSFKAVQDW